MCQLWRDSSSTLCQVGRGGPLPLLSGSRFFRSCFLNKYWSKSPRQWAAPWAASLLPFFFFNACLSVCAPSTHTESGRIHKLLGVAAFGVGIGMSWRKTCFFHFFSTISVLYFFLNKHMHLFKKKNFEKRGQQRGDFCMGEELFEGETETLVWPSLIWWQLLTSGFSCLSHACCGEHPPSVFLWINFLATIINSKFCRASVFHVIVPYRILTDLLLLRDLLIFMVIFHALWWGMDWKEEGQTAVIFHSLLLWRLIFRQNDEAEIFIKFQWCEVFFFCFVFLNTVFMS